MTSNSVTSEDCLICAKHRGEGSLVGGPLIWSDDHVLVFHKPPSISGRVFLGHLFVETRRHVSYVDELTDAEATTVGWAVARGAKALRRTLNPEAVFSAIVGRAVPHFHQHVFVRHEGTPRELGWMAGNEWADAPHGDATDLGHLADRLRPHFTASSRRIPEGQPTTS